MKPPTPRAVIGLPPNAQATLTPTAPYGERGYGAFDCEGHLWFFGQRVDDAAWDAATKGSA